MTAPAIEVSEITYAYPSRPAALRNVSLSISAGEFVALVGQNGSGKTTLAKHFNGILRPQAGRVQVDGQDVAGRSTAQMASMVGYCYQNPDHQIFASTVAEEIEFGPRNLGVLQEEIVRRTKRLLDVVRLRTSGVPTRSASAVVNVRSSPLPPSLRWNPASSSSTSRRRGSIGKAEKR